MAQADCQGPSASCASACSDVDNVINDRGWTPYAGVEATFFSPNFNNSAVLSVTSSDVVNGTVTTDTSGTGTGSFGIAPRIWFGIAGDNGWGVRVRYWQFNQSSYQFDPLTYFLNPADRTGFTSFNSFKMYTLDLEATKEFCYNDWLLLGSFGARHASLQQAESLNTQVISDPILPFYDYATAQAFGSGTFNGTGLTGGLQALLPLCESCCGDLSFFASARGSALWGTSSGSAQTAATATSNVLLFNSAAGYNYAAYSNDGSTMYVGELQAGLQLNKNLACCNNARAFFRVAFEYQYWQLDNSGTANATTTAAVLGVGGVTGATANASSRNFDGLDLVGLSIATGFYW
jgi:hypothetical protein